MERHQPPREIMQSQMQEERKGNRVGKVKRIKNYIIYLEDVLGKGAFAMVYVGENQNDKKKYAVKQISNSALQDKVGEEKKKALLESELEISKKFNHPNIVKFYDFITTENNSYMIYEICLGGDLKQFLKEKKRLPELVAQRFIYQIAQSLKQLFYQSILHRDLKPQNFLLSEKSENAVIKLADFGLAKYYEREEDLFSTICGTPIYMAPEIQKMTSYSDKCDLWSVGIILFEMIAGKPPFEGRNKVELFQNIEKGQYKFPPEVKPSTLCIDILKKLLVSNPEYRISWQEFFEHPFINCQPHTYSKIYRDMMIGNNLKKEDSKKNINKEEEKKPLSQEKPMRFPEQKVSEVSKGILQPSAIPVSQGSAERGGSSLESLTQEDLEEALDVVESAFRAVFLKSKVVMEVVKEEVETIQTHEPYKFEKELKFIAYRILSDLKAIIILLLQKSFLTGLKDESIIAKLNKVSNRIQDFTNKSNNQTEVESNYSLKVFSAQPMQINFTAFLMNKLAEKHGNTLSGFFPELLTQFDEITTFLADFSYLIPQIEAKKIQADITNYALQLSQQAVMAKSLYEEDKAAKKFKFATFIMEEIQRKYCFILKRDISVSEKDFVIDEAIGSSPVTQQAGALQGILDQFKNQQFFHMEIAA